MPQLITCCSRLARVDGCRPEPAISNLKKRFPTRSSMRGYSGPESDKSREHEGGALVMKGLTFRMWPQRFSFASFEVHSSTLARDEASSRESHLQQHRRAVCPSPQRDGSISAACYSVRICA